MSTYKLIITNILKMENSVFLYNYIDDGIDNIIKLIFEMLLCKEINIKNKYAFLKESLNNFLIKHNKEDCFITYFCKIQKVYNILNKFVYNYKFKKARTVVTADMFLNEIKPSDKNVICIFHNNSKYLFHINDLIKIINSALSNAYMYFSEPKCIKNPYDNIPFKKSTLYNIYFFIRYKTDYYPELFFKFFNVDFNVTIFKNKNEYILREYSINHFVNNSTSNVLMEEIKNMIDYYNQYCKQVQLKNKIVINKEFPKDKLIQIMRPYLKIFMTAQYSYLTHIKREATYILQQKLLMFNNFNPIFGRKKYKIVKKYTHDFNRVITHRITEFDEKHIQFNNIEKQNADYLTDHLKYAETIIVNERSIVRRSFTFNFASHINFNEDEQYDDEDEQDDDDEDEQDNDDDEDDPDDDDEDDNNTGTTQQLTTADAFEFDADVVSVTDSVS
jgi:hypothetical protein